MYRAGVWQMTSIGPSGGRHVLVTDGQVVYRRVPKDEVDLVVQLQETGLLKELSAQDLILPCDVLHEDDCSYPLTLALPFIKEITYPFEWSPSMLKDAAGCVLDLETLLRERGYTLADPFAWNVSFRHSQPVYLDLECIRPKEATTGGVWGRDGLFCQYFLYPLELHAAGLHRVARALLADYWQGVRREEVSYFARQAGIKAIMPRDLRRAIKVAYRRVWKPVPVQSGGDSLTQLRSSLTHIRLQETSYWSSYQNEKRQDALWSKKVEAVHAVVDRCQPRSVLDLGGNQGEITAEVASHADVRCVVTDRDDACVDAAYLAAKSKGLPITPVVMDIRQPADAVTLARGSLRSAYDRFECDLVLALALLHHLVGTGFGQVSMEQAIVMLGRFARRHLAVEFVPRGDPWWPKSGSPPDWWSIEHLRAVLRKLGWQVKVELESHPPGRTILVGERERIET